jgi:branched-chain amino acid transport system ATP-binding protein
MSLLILNGVESFYGRIKVLHGISVEVNEGEIAAIVGSNGAGKSTLLNTIAGVKLCDYGTIEMKGERIDNRDPDEVVKMGISLVPEGRRVFADLTLKENLRMGAFTRKDNNEINNSLEWVYTLFPRLKERESSLAKHLSGGEQQMLSIGRGLMSKPKLLMLDEPSLGLSPLLMKVVFSTIKSINEAGTSILLVEQNVKGAFKIANSAYIMLLGHIDKSGTPEELARDEDIRTSYMGEGKYVDRKELWRGRASSRR